MCRIQKACWVGLWLRVAWILAPSSCSRRSCWERRRRAAVAKARQIHARLADAGYPSRTPAAIATPHLDPGIEQPRLKCDLVKMVAGASTAASWPPSLSTACNAEGTAARSAAWSGISAIRRLATAMHPTAASWPTRRTTLC